MRISSHPIKKLTVLSIFAGGYVLGARAGRERYEQIVDAANKVKADPRVNDVISRAEGVVGDAAGMTGDAGGTSTGEAPTAGRTDDEDELVYSAGPDIEETVDELRAHDDSERI